jgi:hypothetical protein
VRSKRIEPKSIDGKGADIMLRKPLIRRPVAAALMLLGATMMYLALETWAGALVFALGALIEVAGIAIKREE